jgi:hypothetical protein
MTAALRTEPIPAGLCQCGCGGATNLASDTSRTRGWVKGQPLRFIDGHNTRGAGSPFWRGGTDPYKSAPKADRKRGVTREHRLIAERALGKPLPEKSVVHHFNADGRDNGPGNLVLCEDQSYHLLLHARQRAIESRESPLRLECAWCDTLLRDGREPTSHGICEACSERVFPVRSTRSSQ